MTVLSIGGPGILYFPVAYPGVSLQTGKVRVESPYVAPKLNLRSKKKSIVMIQLSSNLKRLMRTN